MFPLFTFEIGRIFGLMNSTLYDFAYIRKTSLADRISSNRSHNSSHAEFEDADTKIYLSVERIISSMAATKVRVLPVPLKLLIIILEIL